MMPEVSGIYKLTHRTSGDTYIGQAENMLRRARQHFADLTAGNHRSRKISQCASEFGADGFLVETIERCPLEKLDEREVYWIDRLQPSLNSNGGCRTRDSEALSIRIDVPNLIDQQLAEWARRDRRSKREHVAFVIEQIVACYESEPQILDWLALYRAGEVRFETLHEMGRARKEAAASK